MPRKQSFARVGWCYRTRAANLPIVYIERDGKVYPEEPVLTSIKMVPYWDFLEDPDKQVK